MKIGVIGSGNIGGTAARLWTRAGHTVLLSYSRDPRKLDDLAATIGDGAGTGTPDEAARYGNVVVLSVPWGRVEDALSAAGGAGAFEGKIVIDTTNPFEAGGPSLDRGSAGEAVAALLPGAKVVKAYNTLESHTLARAGEAGQSGGERLALLYCGDDEAAKELVASLIDDSGLEAVDAGPLGNARLQEPGGPYFNSPFGPDEARERIRASGIAG